MRIITREIVCPQDPAIKLVLTNEGFELEAEHEFGVFVGPDNQQANFEGAWQWLAEVLEIQARCPLRLGWLEHVAPWVVIESINEWRSFRSQAADIALESWWKELSSVPRDAKGRLTENWRMFEKGARRREVVGWFERTGGFFDLDFQLLRWNKWK